MYLPDYNNTGKMNEIKWVMDRDMQTLFWEEDPYCSGFAVSTMPCYLRESDMLLVPYTPV